MFSLTQPLSACTRRRAALRLSTARRAHKSSPYRREPLLLLHTSPTLHAPPPPHTYFHSTHSLPHLALGQPLRSPLGHPLPIPQIHRSLLPGLRHAARAFLSPARRSDRSVALQLPAPFHHPAPHHPRCPLLAKKPPLSPPHLPAGCDRLCLHSDSVAHRTKSIWDLMEISRRTLLLKNTNELVSPLTFREIHSLRSTLLPSKEVRTTHRRSQIFHVLRTHLRPKSAGISPHWSVSHFKMGLVTRCALSQASARAIIS